MLASGCPVLPGGCLAFDGAVNATGDCFYHALLRLLRAYHMGPAALRAGTEADGVAFLRNATADYATWHVVHGSALGRFVTQAAIHDETDRDYDPTLMKLWGGFTNAAGLPIDLLDPRNRIADPALAEKLLSFMTVRINKIRVKNNYAMEMDTILVAHMVDAGLRLPCGTQKTTLVLPDCDLAPGHALTAAAAGGATTQPPMQLRTFQPLPVLSFAYYRGSEHCLAVYDRALHRVCAYVLGGLGGIRSGDAAITTSWAALTSRTMEAMRVCVLAAIDERGLSPAAAAFVIAALDRAYSAAESIVPAPLPRVVRSEAPVAAEAYSVAEVRAAEADAVLLASRALETLRTGAAPAASLVSRPPVAAIAASAQPQEKRNEPPQVDMVPQQEQEQQQPQQEQEQQQPQQQPQQHDEQVCF